MRLHQVIRILIGVLFTLPLVAYADIAAILQQPPNLNPNLAAFPDSSLVSRAYILEAPAGKHGFCTVKDGHFTFADGTRARFFGVNVAKETLFIDKAQIDRLVNVFARSGINLVRIHHIDDVQGILDPGPDRYFRPERLDLIDYWIAKLKERGIYVCLDLNDYRTFRSAEGVPNGEKLGRGAKPYAVFDERLIELQQEYAKKFLVDHVNPYTGLSFANDPVVAFLEIYDENGLIIRRSDWPSLIEPYRTNLQQQWNAWLRYRYGTTAGLRAAWTNRGGNCALKTTESLEQATVQLPKLRLGFEIATSFNDGLVAPARQNDGILFAYEMQMSYLRTMHEYLREIGVRIPVTAVGAQDVLPDVMATAATTDYIGINYYWDHPMWNTGNSWNLPFYFSLNNPLVDNLNYSFPVSVAEARMYNKPLVVRELGYCFPNQYRGVGMIESAAYGALLDVDALILFTYDAHANARTIGYFDIHLDPLRWGLVSQAARLFLSGEVQAARNTVGIGFSEVDAFTWYDYSSSLYQLAFATKVVNYTDAATPNPLDLLIASGRSSGSTWLGNKLLLNANHDHTDLHYQGTATGLDERHGYTLQRGGAGVFNFIFRGWGYDYGTAREGQAWPAYAAQDVTAKGLEPLAVNNGNAIGFLDNRKKILGFHNLRADLASRFALDALHNWNNAPVSHSDLDQNRWRSDTGQIERNLAARVLRVDTPTLQALAGRFDVPAPLRTSAVALSTQTPIGTLTAESLDGKPLAQSQVYLVKMTSKARNDQVKIAPANDGPKPFKLTSAGVPPIRTDGTPTIKPTRVELGETLLIELYLQNGTWEYLAEPNRALLYLDTGDITVNLPRTPKLIRWYTAGDTLELTPKESKFTVPAGVKYTEIVWE